MWVRGLCVVLLMQVPLFAQVVPQSNVSVWIADVLANPSRHWNMTVTITGQVRDVTANPVGTTRGTYTLFDDSSPNPITVRSRDLPPVGREFAVTGIIIQDPAKAGTPLLDELSRADPGMSATVRYLLIGGGLVFAGLLIVLVMMLMKPKGRPAAAPSYPVPAPSMAAPAAAPPPALFEPTRKLPSTSARAAAPEDDRTKVFMSLGVELEIEKGPDKGRTYAVHKPVTTIGRPGPRKNDLELTDDTVSKEQASIFYDPSSHAFTLVNESTTNPTSVNGSIVTDRVALTAGALVQAGSTAIRFRKA